MAGNSQILVTTFGMSWPIVPELLAFTNPEMVSLLKHSPQNHHLRELRAKFQIQPVNEVWIITTEGTRDRMKLSQWFHGLSDQNLTWRTFVAKGVEDLSTAQECEWMSDLVYRVVLMAHTEKGNQGKVYLSLAGGRKTMSADMQQAAYVLGCDALFHIAAPPKPATPLDGNNVSALYDPLNADVAATISPIIISGHLEPAPFLYVQPRIDHNSFPMPLPGNGEETSIDPETSLIREIQKRQQNARNLLFSFRSEMIKNSMHQNFMSLYSLHPSEILQLKTEFIGVDPLKKSEEMDWLRKIPKAELHCHLGGILHPEDHIEVACVLINEVTNMRKSNPDFNKWLTEVRKIVKVGDLSALIELTPHLKAIRNHFNFPEPINVCAFLQQFDGYPDLLKTFIYSGIDPASGFVGIGIDRYEKLGDLQGSGLLQCEATIRKSLQILKRQCEEDEVRYIEVRCSPCNYTRGGLNAEEVVNFILDELDNHPYIQFRIIFIASRHRDIEILKQHLELYHELKGDERFRRMFVGFDLAGNEAAGKPGDLREYFLDVMADSVNMTIHAGEDQPAESIWEAIYHLNADRIGHGLSLRENTPLLTRIVNRGIALEMCPSSNDQVVGFKNFQTDNSVSRIYPLREYLNKGLRVTINTDDPGMSLTSLSQEYYKAATMTRNGLSRWDILQMVKNGFQASFAGFEKRKLLLEEAGNKVFEIGV